MSAVLHGGEDAVLSHWSAASLWRMRPGTGPRTHVTCPRTRRSGREDGIDDLSRLLAASARRSRAAA